MTNCPNCGAIITGPICEYCGTRFDVEFKVKRSIGEARHKVGMTMQEAADAFSKLGRLL